MGSLDDDVAERVFDIFDHELKKSGIIHIGGAAEAHDPRYTRILHLIQSPRDDNRARAAATASGESE